MNDQKQMTEDEIQKIRRELEDEVAKLVSEGVWGVTAIPGIRYIGRIHKIYRFTDGVVRESFKSKVDVLQAMPGYVELFPAFEYLINLGQRPDSGLVKTPKTLTLDMTGSMTPYYLYCPNFLFFEDVKKDEMEMYKGLIANGVLMTRHSIYSEVDRNEARDTGPRILTPDQAAAEIEALKRGQRR
jgi:hypothetical protein